jgi:hypothetical protein
MLDFARMYDFTFEMTTNTSLVTSSDIGSSLLAAGFPVPVAACRCTDELGVTTPALRF